MKNIVKLKTIQRIVGIIALAAVIGFSMAACDDGSGDNGNGNGNGNGTTITYTVTAASGTPTTALTFTFSADPGNLSASEITLTGNASKGSATVAGTGTTRTLSPITVSAAGSATVSISKSGVETASKTVTVNSGSGGGGGNPFIGTWTGDGLTLTCTDSTWSAMGMSGSYTRNGNSATFTQTGGSIFGTAAVSGNTMTVNSNNEVFTLSKENGNNGGVLGSTGPGGGKVFYYSEAGFTMTDDNQVCHYLEAAPADMPTPLAWASSGYSENTNTNISGTGTAIGTGRKNTALILATDANAPAAKACNDYSNNGKTDWFLPSKDELNELRKNKGVAGIVVTNSSYYWTSSQYDSNRAWRQTLDDGYQDYGDGNKSRNGSVRAVRAY